MTDAFSQAPAQPIIGQAEVAETTPDEGSAQEQPQTERPLTAEDYRQIAREEALRVAQSQMAKGENRINQRIAERFAALETNTGVLKLTEAQVAQAKREIVAEEQVKDFEPSPQASGKSQVTPPENVDAGQFVSQQIDVAFDSAGGTKVTPQDKEWATIQAQLDNPKGSLFLTQLSAVEASRAKAARLAAQQQRAPARVISTGGEGTTQPQTFRTPEEKIKAGLTGSQWNNASGK